MSMFHRKLSKLPQKHTFSKLKLEIEEISNLMENGFKMTTFAG